MKCPTILLIAFLSVTRALAVTPEELAGDLKDRALASESRNDFKTSQILLTLAKRACPEDAEFDDLLTGIRSRHASREMKRGEDAEKSGDFDEARLAYDAAFGLDPALLGLDTARSGMNRRIAGYEVKRGTEAEKAGDLTDALEAFDIAFKLAPSIPGLRDSLSGVVRKLMETNPLDVPVTGFECRNLSLREGLTQLSDAVASASDGKARFDFQESTHYVMGIRNLTLDPSSPTVTAGAILSELIHKSRFNDARYEFTGPGNYPQLVLRSLREGDFTGIINDWPKFRNLPELPRENPPPPTTIPPIARTRAEAVEWTAAGGQKTEAVFVKIEGETLFLNKDGRELKVPLSSLTPESLAQATRFDIAPASVLAHYTFDDPGGVTLTDHSGKDHHGTLTDFKDTSANAGKFDHKTGWTGNGAIKFDGKSTSIPIPISSGDLKGKSFTIEAIVAHNPEFTYYRNILGAQCPDYRAPGNLQIYKVPPDWKKGPDSGFAWRINGLTPDVPAGGGETAINDGNFHHIALVRDVGQGTVSLFFDHALISITNVTGEINGDWPLVIGTCYYNNSSSWNKLMSEIRITTEALPVSKFLIDVKKPMPASPPLTGDLPTGAPKPPSAPLSDPPIARTRTMPSEWKSADGSSLEATFERISNETLVLNKEGKELEIPLSQLSPESLAKAHRCDIDPQDVLLHYTFDDNQGETLTDHSGKGNHGTLKQFSNNPVGSWTGDGALDFDGRDDWVESSLTSGSLDGRSFTIEGIATHRNATRDWTSLISTSVRDSSRPGLVHLMKDKAKPAENIPGSALAWQITGFTPDRVAMTEPTALDDGGFHHFALVRDMEKNEVRVYFDHQLVNRTQGVTGEIGGSSAKFMIGGVYWNRSDRWPGLISDIRITAQALPPSKFLKRPTNGVEE